MKQLTENKKKELDRLKEWSTTILDFFVKSSNEQEFLSLLEQIPKIISVAYIRQDLRGLKFIANDMADLAKGLKKDQIDELNVMLVEKFGEDIFKTQKKARKIVARGEIRNKSEYKLVFDYLEEIYDVNEKQSEIDQVNSVLEAWQTKTGKV